MRNLALAAVDQGGVAANLQVTGVARNLSPAQAADLPLLLARVVVPKHPLKPSLNNSYSIVEPLRIVAGVILRMSGMYRRLKLPSSSANLPAKRPKSTE